MPVLLHSMPQVTIAAINGACAGAGLGWACACDLRYAVADAKLNTAFLDVAVAGDMGLPWTLPRIVGAGRARELSLLPRKLDGRRGGGDRARQRGVLDAVELLRVEVGARADRIAAAAPLARRAMKAHYVAADGMSFADLVALETERPPADHPVRRLPRRRSAPSSRSARPCSRDGDAMWLRLRQIALVARDLDPVLERRPRRARPRGRLPRPPHRAARPAQRRHPGRRAVPRDRQPDPRGHDGRALPRSPRRRRRLHGHHPVRRPPAPPGPRRGARHPHRRRSSTTTASPTSSSTRPTPAARSSRSTSRTAASPRRPLEPGRTGLARRPSAPTSSRRSRRPRCSARTPTRSRRGGRRSSRSTSRTATACRRCRWRTPTLRFVPVTDGRGEGLGGIDLARRRRRPAARRGRRARGVLADDGAHVVIGGVRMYLR